MKRCGFLLAICCGFWLPGASANGPVPVSLQNVPIPPVPGLLDGAAPIVVNKKAAIILGKALFWDNNVGSDGQACASCHYSAGADGRTRNQLNPGQNGSGAGAETFSVLPSGGGGPNHVLSLADFPFQQFSNPLSNASQVVYSTDDVAASAGTFGGQFTGSSQFTGRSDQCRRSADPLFNVNGIGVRRVEPRNTPTVINAVFNHRNFWDGRASNSFNGSSPWGERDPNAGVWIKTAATQVGKRRLNLPNSALASQAVTPPVFNDIEMGCAARGWPDIGRKLLLRQPLQYQQVHYQDSVLGPYSRSSSAGLQTGLNTTYRSLITQAFNPSYWSYVGVGPFGAPAAGGVAYNQMEANFAMFFGLAIQLYESTLVSDQSPFDLSPVDANLKPTWSNIVADTPADTAAQIASLSNGFNLFTSNNCNLCHTGPTLSLAALTTNATLLTPAAGSTFGPAATPIAYGPDAFGPYAAAADAGATRYVNPVTRAYNTALQPMLMDQGFMNIGVTAPAADPGLAGVDGLGNPLAYAAQYVNYLIGNTAGVIDLPIADVRACDFLTGLAYDVQLSSNAYFLPSDGLIPDGSREGVLRNQNCANPAMAYIPTIAAAQAAEGGPKLALATQAAFKVPTLRNVELTGPYMHNGGMATLAQVIEFYARHGNFVSNSLHFNLGAISTQLTSQQNLTDLSNFLLALTDDRVRYQRAPFDHPQLLLINGQVGSDTAVTAGNALDSALAQDRLLVIPAVGAAGAATPLQAFPAP